MSTSERELGDCQRTCAELVTDANAITLAESLQRKCAEVARLLVVNEGLKDAHKYFREEVTFLATGVNELADRFKDDKQLALVAGLFSDKTALTAQLNACHEQFDRIKAVLPPRAGGYSGEELVTTMLAERVALSVELAEAKRLHQEQFDLYCAETKRHNETWAQIHAATAYMDKECQKLPDGLLAKVKEVFFRMTLVEMGRDSLKGQVATLTQQLAEANKANENYRTGFLPETTALHDILRQAGCVSVNAKEYEVLTASNEALKRALRDVTEWAETMEAVKAHPFLNNEAIVHARALLSASTPDAGTGEKTEPQVHKIALRRAFVKVIDGLGAQLLGVEFGEGKLSAAHLRWMLTECLSRIREMPVDKMGRWVGYVQGVMAANGKLDVEEERNRTRPFFEAAYTKNLSTPAASAQGEKGREET